jgi:hypothetical protein
MVDGGGVGGGVVDQLRDLQLPVYEVIFGAKPDGLDGNVKYANKKAEIYGLGRKWLDTGSIVESVQGRSVAEDMSTPTYTINDKTGIQIEAKSMIKSRGADSPDLAEAFFCTFAFPVIETSKYNKGRHFETDYDPMTLLEDY